VGGGLVRGLGFAAKTQGRGAGTAWQLKYNKKKLK